MAFDPDDPEQAHCKRCHDTGYAFGSDKVCRCVAGGLRDLAVMDRRT